MASEALIVVDVQNDFCPGGALAVAGGDEIVPPSTGSSQRFDHVVLTQDWHPRAHSSFASSHPGRHALRDDRDALRPADAVAGPLRAGHRRARSSIRTSPGPRPSSIIRKGFRRAIDSYSAFFENDHKTPTGLAGYLRERGIRTVVIAGLATDICVAYSALDAARLGFDDDVRLDACRGIDLGGSLAAS